MLFVGQLVLLLSSKLRMSVFVVLMLHMHLLQSNNNEREKNDGVSDCFTNHTGSAERGW